MLKLSNKILNRINYREETNQAVIDFELTEEHLALQNTVREFVAG